MTQTEEWDRLQAELKAWREIAQEKHQEVSQLQQEKQVLREALAEAIQAIERAQEHTKDLEKQIEVLHDRVKTLEGQLAKDSHNSSLPPSSDRFVRHPKSLKQKSGKKPGGQPGHHLKLVEQPDMVLVHAVEHCLHCQRDLRTCSAIIAERRQVIDLPVKRLWVTEHQVEEKQCPQCSHLTRAPFPPTVKAPAQYGTGIQAFAVALVQGQVVPYARASQLFHDLLGVQLSSGSIASFVTTCHQSLAGVERQIKAAPVPAPALL